MRVIVVYDIETKRVGKVCQYLRRHLNWVQNSVFEGEITVAGLRRIQNELRDIVDESHDSVLFYVFPDGTKWTRDVIGIEKLGANNIL